MLNPYFIVRMIGLEPTCREALAPETSVSTISPHPRQTGCKDTKSFPIHKQRERTKHRQHQITIS